MKKGFLLLAIAFTMVFITIGTDMAKAEYGDIVLNNKASEAGMNPVLFPHWFHRIRFKCKVCHEDIFIMKKGANDIDMSKIMEGEFCGKCHNGLIAWEALYCDRCHSYEQE